MPAWKWIVMFSIMLNVLIPFCSAAVSNREGFFSIDPVAITFNAQYIYTYSEPVTVTVTNTGDSLLVIETVILSGNMPGAFIIDDDNRYPMYLDPDSSMIFTVTFHPTQAFDYNAEIILTDNLNRTEHILPLSGSGNDDLIHDFPYNIDFESNLFPPTDWTVANSANPLYGWRRSIYGNAHTGNAYAAVGLNAGNHWLITPAFIITPQSNTLRFWLKNGNEIPDSASTSASEYLDVLLSTTSADTTRFHTTLLHYTNLNIPETYLEIVVDLSIYSETVIRLAFKRHSTNGKYVYLDDFSLSGPPPGTFNPPTNLYADVDSNRVVLTWQVPIHEINDHLTGYKVYRNNIPIQTIVGPGVTTWIDDAVNFGFYNYKVTALYGFGESVYSNAFPVDITYGYPNLVFADSFEDYPDFAMSFGRWTNLDEDNSNTFNFDQIIYPNMSVPKAFLVFNPTATTPPMTYLAARSGNKMLACFDSANPPNNDWLITRRIQLGTNSSFNFWAKSYTAYYGLEKFNVLISTTDMNPESFISITGEDTVHVPAVQWNSFNYDLAAYDNRLVYLAIQCVSDYSVALLVDDVKVVSTGGTMGNNDPITISNSSLLVGNYPNPFNPNTNIRFNLQIRQKVLLEIYNIKGQKVRTLCNDLKEAGSQSVQWNGKDDAGRAVASGVYFYRMNTGSFIQTKKMVLLK